MENNIENNLEKKSYIKNNEIGKVRRIFALIGGISGVLISIFFLFDSSGGSLINLSDFWWFFLYDLINSVMLFMTFFIKRIWFLKISFFVFLIGCIPPLITYHIYGIWLLFGFPILFLFASVWNYVYLFGNWKEDKKINFNNNEIDNTDSLEKAREKKVIRYVVIIFIIFFVLGVLGSLFYNFFSFRI